MKRFVNITLVVLLSVIAFTAIYKISPTARVATDEALVWANNLGRNPGDPFYLTMHYRIRRLYFDLTSFRTKEPIVFFGDSITLGVDWDELFPKEKVANRGISGDTTLGLLNRQGEIIALKPRQIFIMIGSNDLCFERPIDMIIANYQLILDRFQKELPDTPVYIQSVLPINDNLFESVGLRNNDYIYRLNIELRKMAKKNNCPYIDLSARFSGRDGRLLQEYTYDGLHLNEYAHRIWRDQIESLVSKARTSS